MTYVLWIVQALLAFAFVGAGGLKLFTPIEQLAPMIPLPGLFIRFVGVAEVLGGLGLILPGLVRIRANLTSLAAVELVHVMLAATVITLATSDAALALFPLAMALLAAFVAYGRWRVAPYRAERSWSRRAVLQPAGQH